MKALTALVAAACLTLGYPGYAQQRGPHQHGAALLEIATEGDMMELRLESPLDSLVGFENAPRNVKQREAIRQMAGRFHQPDRLFVPTVEAGCSATSVILRSAVVAPDLLAAGGSAGGAAGGGAGGTAGGTAGKAAAVPATAGSQVGNEGPGPGHADLDVSITYRCERPQALEGIRVLLFQSFSELERIDAQVVTGKGQSSTRLSPKSNLLRW